jgi:hypothetical protein
LVRSSYHAAEGFVAARLRPSTGPLRTVEPAPAPETKALVSPERLIAGKREARRN